MIHSSHGCLHLNQMASAKADEKTKKMGFTVRTGCLHLNQIASAEAGEKTKKLRFTLIAFQTSIVYTYSA